jgi:hypothetical protein
MTLRRWITFASAAAMIAGVSACKDSGGGSSVGGRTSAGASPGSNDSTQGRRPDTLPRARGADAGSDMTTGSSNTTTTPSGSQDVTGSAGATSGRPSDTTGAGSTGANTPSGSTTDSSKK